MPHPILETTAQATAHPKLHNRDVDVKAHFGAAGDGSTDDTAAIQAAIDAAIAAKVGVYVPPVSSYYKVTNQANNRALKLAADGVTLFGAGYRSRIHNASADSSCVVVGEDSAADSAVYTGVAIASLRFTQTLPHTADDFAAVRVRSAYGFRLLDNDFEDCAVAWSVNQRNTTDVKPEACIVCGNRVRMNATGGRIGIEMMGCKACLVKGNILTSTLTAQPGIRIVHDTDSIVEGNFVRGFNTGINVQARNPGNYLGPGFRTQIIGNHVVGGLGTASVGIIASNSLSDVVVQDNYVDDYINLIRLKVDTAGGNDRPVIKGNFLRSSSQTTTCILADAPSGGFDNTDVYVEDNHIEALLGGNAIDLQTVDGRNYIRNNFIATSDAGNAITAVVPAGSETYALWNTITGVSVSIANDLNGSGSGKFVHWDHSGHEANTLVSTGGADLVESIFSAAQITANQNDYDPLFGSGRQSSIWRLNTDASRNITGIAGGWSGRRLNIINVGGFNIVLQNQNVGSAAGNRIITGTAADVTLAPDDTATLIYDDTTARWRMIAPTL